MSVAAAPETITLTIDGQTITTAPGRTILQVARANGIRIPTLCDLPGLSPVGACRVCVVQLQPGNRLVPACAVNAEAGMQITASSETLDTLRRGVVEMLFAERNHICSVCVANGHCELQNLARTLGIGEVRVDYRFPVLGVDASHARFAIDHNRCVLCLRCVRVCDEIEGAHTWDVMGRGINSRVITDLNTPWGESATCTSCGKCVQVCPTGAIFVKGRAVGEMTRDLRFLTHLTEMRGQR